MTNIAQDPEREERITMQIVVDAYDSEEQVMGWYYYLQDTMQFPFPAIRVNQKRNSTAEKHEAVEVVGMATEEECEQEMFVEIAFEGDEFAVPLIEVEAPAAEAKTQQAIEDWHYWVNRGY
ncbi:hypothetical protein C1752_02069 [Acaryochloris thomasi RCC1774]|uniref:Calcium-binding protein n=1 Tax=Acaryochloris thomasi RCC1774 TaxID=1764569 RepID=A0A2W1JJN5_9CYAN|nr:calcium-binding protein [Acaryochloris thomasi]PZD73650.1 hypothetical protein C1752_02069 [Acaryochloris thomasi RCC1774]